MDGSPGGSSDSKKMRRSYSIREKLEVLDRLDELGSNVKRTSRETGIHPKCLSSWYRKRDQLRSAMKCSARRMGMLALVNVTYTNQYIFVCCNNPCSGYSVRVVC